MLNCLLKASSESLAKICSDYLFIYLFISYSSFIRSPIMLLTESCCCACRLLKLLINTCNAVAKYERMSVNYEQTKFIHLRTVQCFVH